MSRLTGEADRTVTLTVRLGRPYHVDLRRGLLRDEVTVWQDVRPALGGRIERRTAWRGKGDALFDEVLQWAKDIIDPPR